jgi:hypothetical protein
LKASVVSGPAIDTSLYTRESSRYVSSLTRLYPSSFQDLTTSTPSGSVRAERNMSP